MSYQKQLLSKCCEAPLMTSTGDEGTSCYICRKCNKPSDPKEQKKCGKLIHASEGTICENDVPCVLHTTPTESTTECRHKYTTLLNGTKYCPECNKNIPSPTKPDKECPYNHTEAEHLESGCLGHFKPGKQDAIQVDIQDSWEKEFDQCFVRQGFPIGIISYTNKDGTDITRPKIKSFILQEKEKSYEQGKRETQNDWFDMCEKEIEVARQSMLREIMEMVEDFGKSIRIKHADVKNNGNLRYTEYVRACMDVVTIQHNQKVDSFLSKLKSKLTQK